MPKIKDLSPETTVRKAFSDKLRACAYVTYRGMPGFGSAVRLSESTIRKRVADPRTFDLMELRRVRKALGLSIDDVVDFVREVV